MHFKLRSKLTLLLLAAAGVAFAAQGVSLFWGAKSFAKAKSQLAAKERQLTSLANAEPAPTQAYADALARELADLPSAVARSESLWRDNSIARARAAAPPPPNRRAAYFDLMRYRQSLADLAREQGVEIGADEFFGFRAYANEGPAEADISAVYMQRLVLARVLESLLHSKPQRILAVIRQEGNASADGFGGAEFAPANRGYRFQIRFLGTTAVLRAWLNELADMPLPILVRSVTVEPAPERQVIPIRGRSNAAFSSAPFAESGVGDGFEPLVRPSSSEFLVTLDYVELEPQEESEATSGEFSPSSEISPKRLMTWPEPEPQGRGPQWVFEVFTPPEIFYHPLRQQFYVKAVFPSADPVIVSNSLAESTRGPRNLPRLLGVRHEDYPLQLSGYVGGATGDVFGGESGGLLFGLFENRESGETLLLRGGDRVESLGIEVLDLRVEEQPLAEPAITPLRELRAVATIRSAQEDRRTLREGERAEGPGLVAHVELSGQHLELREDDVLERKDGQQLTVTEIQSEPEPRVVMKNHDGSSIADTLPEALPIILVIESVPADSTD